MRATMEDLVTLRPVDGKPRRALVHRDDTLTFTFSLTGRSSQTGLTTISRSDRTVELDNTNDIEASDLLGLGSSSASSKPMSLDNRPEVCHGDSSVVDDWEELATDEENVGTQGLASVHSSKLELAHLRATEKSLGIAAEAHPFHIEEESSKSEDEDDWLTDAPTVALAGPSLPCFVVNLTRLCGADGPLSDDQRQLSREIMDDQLSNDFAASSAELLETEFCWSTDTYECERLIKELETDDESGAFEIFHFPEYVSGVSVAHLWSILTRPTEWRSVNMVKEFLRKTNRELKWKADIAEEVEKLAKQEAADKLQRQANIEREVDQLSRLRESFRSRLEDATLTDKVKKRLLRAKLEEIETKLEYLVTMRMTELAKEQTNARAIVDIDKLINEETVRRKGFRLGAMNSEGVPRQNMSLLDMIASMIFDRIPKRRHASEEDHYVRMAVHHMQLRKLWKVEFGQLPRSDSNVVDESSGSENNEDDEIKTDSEASDESDVEDPEREPDCEVALDNNAQHSGTSRVSESNTSAGGDERTIEINGYADDEESSEGGMESEYEADRDDEDDDSDHSGGEEVSSSDPARIENLIVRLTRRIEREGLIRDDEFQAHIVRGDSVQVCEEDKGGTDSELDENLEYDSADSFVPTAQLGGLAVLQAHMEQTSLGTAWDMEREMTSTGNDFGRNRSGSDFSL